MLQSFSPSKLQSQRNYLEQPQPTNLFGGEQQAQVQQQQQQQAIQGQVQQQQQVPQQLQQPGLAQVQQRPAFGLSSPGSLLQWNQPLGQGLLRTRMQQ